jgi:hypothetical protein
MNKHRSGQAIFVVHNTVYACCICEVNALRWLRLECSRASQIRPGPSPLVHLDCLLRRSLFRREAVREVRSLKSEISEDLKLFPDSLMVRTHGGRERS